MVYITTTRIKHGKKWAQNILCQDIKKYSKAEITIAYDEHYDKTEWKRSTSESNDAAL